MATRRGVQSALQRPDAKLDTAKLLLWRYEKRLTLAEIAKLCGTSVEAVHEKLESVAHLMQDPERVRAYRDNEAHILDSLRERIVAHMLDDEKLAKASINNLAFAFSKVHEGARLIRNQSTANIGVRTSVVMGAHRAAGAESDEADADP